MENVMLKSVKYFGFEGQPELRARVEKTLPILEDELRSAADRVSVIWNYRPDVVELEIDDELFGEPSVEYISPEFIGRADDYVRQKVRRLHRDAALEFLGRQVEQMKKNWPSAVGA